ncbi:MAG: hypothetical protein ABJN84_17835 [Flavobacteriaceae bacterium]
MEGMKMENMALFFPIYQITTSGINIILSEQAMNYNVFLLILLVILICCKGRLETDKESEKIVSPEKASVDTLKKSPDEEQGINLEVDIRDIRDQVDDVTTGFLSKKDARIFMKKPNENLYGMYYLIKGSPSDVVGKMIVYDDIHPYLYDKDTDKFIEINLWDKGIELIDGKLQVGVSKDSLIDVLGDDYRENNDILIYKDKHIKGFFKIKNDSVTNIKIGMYRENVAENDILKCEW